MTSLIGQTIGSYRIDEIIGSGGMGKVYRGTHLELGRPAAIKTMHPHIAHDPGFQARFRQEARAAANLLHPGIVQIYDFGQQDGRYYLVMELVTDGSLRVLLPRDPGTTPDLATGLDLTRQAAEALAYAHRNGMIHRDIKPDNLLLRNLADDPDGPPVYQVKVCDFGLARLAEGSIVTASGVTMGTPAYMSPEQCQGLTLDRRSDIYSLGVVLFQVVTGRLPFDVKTPTDAAFRHVFTDPPAPSAVTPGLSPDVEAIILRCLAKQPSQRYALMDQLATALQEVSVGSRSLRTVPVLETAPASEIRATPTPVAPPNTAVAGEPMPSDVADRAGAPTAENIELQRSIASPDEASLNAPGAGSRRPSVPRWALGLAAALLVALALGIGWWFDAGDGDDGQAAGSGDQGEGEPTTAAVVGDSTVGQGVITYTSDGLVYRIEALNGASPEGVSQALDILAPGVDEWLNVSPNGEWLVLATTRLHDDCLDWACLAIVPRDLSSGETVLVDGAVIHPDGVGAVASDGNLIVYPSSDGPHERDLWVVRRHDGGWSPPEILTAESAHTFHLYPALSDDASRVVFDCSTEQDSAICKVAIDGSSLHAVASPSDDAFDGFGVSELHHPDFRSDGAIVFEVSGDSEQVWFIAKPDAAPVVLVADLDHAGSPCVLPDGRVAFIWFNWSDDAPAHELKIALPDGSSYDAILSDPTLEFPGLGCGG